MQNSSHADVREIVLPKLVKNLKKHKQHTTSMQETYNLKVQNFVKKIIANEYPITQHNIVKFLIDLRNKPDTERFYVNELVYDNVINDNIFKTELLGNKRIVNYDDEYCAYITKKNFIIHILRNQNFTNVKLLQKINDRITSLSNSYERTRKIM